MDQDNNTATVEAAKTDLAKILTIPGQPGLYRYVAPSRNGFIVEGLSDGKRSVVSSRVRLSSMADIAVFTDTEEVKLRNVFETLHGILGDAPAPGPKSDSDVLEELFAQAIPDYDSSRFHVSHMRKIVSWYNLLKEYASLEFEDEPEAETETEAPAEAPEETPAQ